jgi:hypothetical protein
VNTELDGGERFRHVKKTRGQDKDEIVELIVG